MGIKEFVGVSTLRYWEYRGTVVNIIKDDSEWYTNLAAAKVKVKEINKYRLLDRFYWFCAIVWLGATIVFLSSSFGLMHYSDGIRIFIHSCLLILSIVQFIVFMYQKYNFLLALALFFNIAWHTYSLYKLLL